jgi:spore germination protein YaaH
MGGDTNIIGLVQGYLEKVPPEKLILAVPYYGYDWPLTLNSSSSSSPSAAIISYAELAQASKEHKLIWDETSQTPSYKYTDKGTQREVHFENVRSLGIKYDFVTAKNLKGVGIWALGYDGLNSDLQRLIVDKFAN